MPVLGGHRGAIGFGHGRQPFLYAFVPRRVSGDGVVAYTVLFQLLVLVLRRSVAVVEQVSVRVGALRPRLRLGRGRHLLVGDGAAARAARMTGARRASWSRAVGWQWCW
ncbi:hypothetical protein [Micromonospora gifhornensis]|uniref:hypothetical protein n=1 Tax=Micromonospora gifhornensis TaxID=84594 RepID=UPI001EF18FAE|nr:hypothetical protein [Micromonospora gifhornensis]